jgi:predicted dehydrogenase
VTLRAAVIGCGAIGVGSATPVHPDVGVYTHAAAYAACADTELVAVADVDPALAREAAARWELADAHVYVSAGALLANARPDLVSLCTPDPTHAYLLEQILIAPGVRGVLAEKPLAEDSARAAAVATLARERGVVLAVNYSRRFAPAIVATAEAIAAGAVGALQHVHGTYVKGLRHNGTHWIDLLRMLVGDPVGARGWDRLREGGTDPSFDAELLLPGGVGARLAALDAREFTAFELELTGTAGRVRLPSAGHRIERWVVGPDERYPGYRVLMPSGADDGVLRDVTLHAVSDLVRCVHGRGEPACSGREATRALVIAEAIATSAASAGRTVPILPLRLDG